MRAFCTSRGACLRSVRERRKGWRGIIRDRRDELTKKVYENLFQNLRIVPRVPAHRLCARSNSCRKRQISTPISGEHYPLSGDYRSNAFETTKALSRFADNIYSASPLARRETAPGLF